MGETRYLISDAAKKVDVETHVLRYWEEELEIGISRTELGHRYYTEEDLWIFQKIKELKDRGLQLKAIKLIIPELKKRCGQPVEEREVPVENIIHLETRTKECVPEEKSQETLPDIGPDPDKLKQFETIMTGILRRVIQENNEELERRMTDSFAKEVGQMIRLQEEREEERFRKLDETIRTYQKNRQMVAVTREPLTEKKKWFRMGKQR